MIQIAAFPVIWALTIAGIYLELRAGIDPTVAALAAATFTIVAVTLLEIFVPFRRAWRPRLHDLRVDGTSLAVTTWGVGALRYWASPLLIATTAGIVARTSLWPATWPYAVQVSIAMLVMQLVTYWWHRAHHVVPLLWRFHAFHHSADRLYWVNASRSHPLEELGSQLLVGLAVLALGAPADVVLIASVALATFGTFQHCNADLAWGPLDKVLATSRVHRWHHSTIAAEADHNYGSCLLLWDHVFGTYRAFAGEAPLELGTGGAAPFPEGYLAQLAAPLAWRVSYEPPRP